MSERRTSDERLGVTGRFAAIPGVCHAFGNAASPMPADFADAPSLKRRQVHGTRIVAVREPGQACGEADGFYTRAVGVMVNVLTADCLPVLFAHQSGRVVAAVHAGWRGLLAGVLEAGVKAFVPPGSASEWCCLIGPAIGPCCYEVDTELGARFAAELDWLDPVVITPAYRHLDIQAIAQARLARCGIGSVEVVRECTLCTTECENDGAGLYRYASYRRDGPGVPNQYACIMRNA